MSNFIIRRPWDFKPTDELERYLASVIKEKPILSPPSSGLTFVEGLCAYVVHREGQFQTQFIIANPGTKIPEHRHPNVDSCEKTKTYSDGLFVFVLSMYTVAGQERKVAVSYQFNIGKTGSHQPASGWTGMVKTWERPIAVRSSGKRYRAFYPGRLRKG